MDNSNVNIDLIRGHVDTIILKSLYYEDKYGYEILNEIKEKSKGMYTLKQPTLYSCLKRLEKQGYIRSYKGDTSNGAQRVYYSLQPAGRAFLESDQHQWEFSRTIIDSLLSSEEFDPDKHVAPFDPSNFRPLTRRNKPSVEGEYDDSSDDEETVQPVQSAQPQGRIFDEDYSRPADESCIPPEMQAPPVDEYDDIPAGYMVEYVNPSQRPATVQPVNTEYYVQNTAPVSEHNDVHDMQNVAYTQTVQQNVQTDNVQPQETPLQDNSDNVYTQNSVEEYNVPDQYGQLESPAVDEEYDDIEEYDAEPVAPVQTPVFFGDERAEAVAQNTQPQEAMQQAQEPPRQNTERESTESYSAYVADHAQSSAEAAAREDARGMLYDRKPEEPKPEVRTYNTDVSQDSVYDDYSNRQTINYIDSFDSIYSVPMTQVTPSQTAVTAAQEDDEKINYLSTSELKAKMMSEGYNLRPYVKKNTSEYYINQYYFSNKLNRDSSVLTYLVYAVGVLIAYFSTAPKYGHNLLGLFGFLALGLLYPIVMFIAYCVDPKKRIKANFHAKNALINSLIVVINAVILIVLIGFLAFGARIDNFDSMVRPVIIPLVFLLIIPIGIAIYYRLYKSNHYHVN